MAQAQAPDAALAQGMAQHLQLLQQQEQQPQPASLADASDAALLLCDQLAQHENHINGVLGGQVGENGLLKACGARCLHGWACWRAFRGVIGNSAAAVAAIMPHSVWQGGVVGCRRHGCSDARSRMWCQVSPYIVTILVGSLLHDLPT